MVFSDVTIRAIAGLLMVSLPIMVAVYLRTSPSRIMGGGGGTASWGVFGMGALCFVGSQIIHVPLNYLVLMPFLVHVVGIYATTPDEKPSFAPLSVLSLVLGLSAGLCEEVMRWMFFHFWLKPKSDGFLSAVTFGVGHGGCEAMLVGIGAIGTLVAMSVFRDGGLPDGIPQESVDQYWAISGFQVMLAPLERVFAMTVHVACSLLVWQSIVLRQLRWLVLAVVLHMVLDAVIVFVLVTWGVIASELVLAAVFFPISIYIIYHYASNHHVEETAFQPLPEDEEDSEFVDSPQELASEDALTEQQ